MTEVQHGKHRGDLAWLPDLSEKLGNAVEFQRLDGFKPIEPSQHLFVTSAEVGPQIVVGGRGMGKSTLLLYRFRHLRKQQDQFQFVRNVPPFGFRLENKCIKIPKDGLTLYTGVAVWSSLWRLVLGMLFAYGIGREELDIPADKPDRWLDYFGVKPDDALFGRVVDRLQAWGESPHDEQLHEVIEPLIRAKIPPSHLDGYFAKHVAGLVGNKKRGDQSPKPWVLFVDCIDEALSTEGDARGILDLDAAKDFLLEDEGERQNAQVLLQNLWVNAQIGYGLAVQKLRHESGGRFLAFGSFRSETYPRFLEEIAPLTPSKVEHLLLRLKPNETPLSEIFEYNVRLTADSDKIARKGVQSPDRMAAACESLCGYLHVNNPTIFGQRETIFDLVCRHNFGTPRGLMMLGGAVRDLAKTRDEKSGKEYRDQASLVQRVNLVAIDVFKEYRDTLFPSWDPSYVKGFQLLTSNVLDADHVTRINKSFESLCPRAEGSQQLPLIEYLYSVGLVGTPRDLGGGKVVQSFALPGQPTISLPAGFSYVVLHPAFAAHIWHQLEASAQARFYSSALVVKPGGPCPVSLLGPLIRAEFQSDGDGARVRATAISSPEQALFDNASSVPAAFLVTLLVAQRYSSDVDFIDESQFVVSATALAKLRYIPESLGYADGRTSDKSRKTISEFFRDVCDNTKHPEPKDQADCIARVNKTLAASGVGVHVIGQYAPEGNAYILGRGSAQDPRPVRRSELQIRGLSTVDYLNAIG